MDKLTNDSKFYVIYGLDNFDHDHYISNVCLTRDEAQTIIHNTPPNGTLPDTYKIIETSLSDLKTGKHHFDSYGVERILEMLEKLKDPFFQRLRMLDLLDKEELLSLHRSVTHNEVNGLPEEISYKGYNIQLQLIKEKILRRMI